MFGKVRLTFYLMMGNSSVLQSYNCSYIRVTEGKLVFQSSNDYKMRSFSLCRIHDVEIRPWE